MIYPVPERHGLGIHLTLNLAGQATFGPDVEWVDAPSFDVDSSRKKYFQEKIVAYFPSVDTEKLHAAYSGIRPKLIDNEDNLCDDFIVEHVRDQNWEAINLMGIESPGLTSSLAIAEHVEAILCA